MSAPNDRVRTVLVGLAIIAAVASLAGYFAWRAGDQAQAAPAPAPASTHD